MKELIFFSESFPRWRRWFWLSRCSISAFINEFVQYRLIQFIICIVLNLFIQYLVWFQIVQYLVLLMSLFNIGWIKQFLTYLVLNQFVQKLVWFQVVLYQILLISSFSEYLGWLIRLSNNWLNSSGYLKSVLKGFPISDFTICGLIIQVIQNLHCKVGFPIFDNNLSCLINQS